jgi:dienelactone hydrolase
MSPLHTSEYAPGKRAIIRDADPAHVALLWHGRGRCQAHVMDRVAAHVAPHQITTVAVDWDSENAEAGRDDLMASLSVVRERYPAARLTLVGWSLGATAAISLANLQPAAVMSSIVALAPGDGPHVRDPFTAGPLPRSFDGGPVPVALVYGTRDPLSTPDRVTGLHMRLRASGWPAQLHGIDADHASIVGSAYVERTEQYVAAPRASSQALAEVARIIAQAATA